jgi:hypothetical protein
LNIQNIWKAGILTWEDADALCISVAFTWDLPFARRYADAMRHRRVRIGGPAVGLAKKKFPGFWLGCHAEIGGHYPGVLQRWNPFATRTSVGCIRMCEFCSVPSVEGAETLEEFGKRQAELPDWPDLPVTADNNLLANSLAHFDRVCDRLEKHEWSDFNQGTDARLVTEHHAERIARLKRPMVRLALDSMSYVDAWDRALERLLRAGVAKRNIRCYCLMAFGTSPGQCWKTCEYVEKNGIKPLPMWFHELNALERNIVTERQSALGWNDYERRRLMQWFYQHKKAVPQSSAHQARATPANTRPPITSGESRALGADGSSDIATSGGETPGSGPREPAIASTFVA